MCITHRRSRQSLQTGESSVSLLSSLSSFSSLSLVSTWALGSLNITVYGYVYVYCIWQMLGRSSKQLKNINTTLLIKNDK